MPKSTFQLPSFAKVNPVLQILGKRSDGYHEIATILQTISLHDDLGFSHREDEAVVLHCDAPDIPKDKNNLIVRAAHALQDFAGRPIGADIRLIKRIPAEGGLGGGSSNAAVTLLALNYLWELGLDLGELERLGSPLGSDVPFFLTGGTARGRGTGSEICSLRDAKKQRLLVVTPRAKVSTARAYEALKSRSLTTKGSVSILASSFAEPTSSDSHQWSLHNDFEGVIFEIEPEIERAKLALLGAGAQGGLLAGSGSSVFGIFENEHAREQALAILESEQGWQVFSCDTVSRAEYSRELSLFGCSLVRSHKIQTDTGA